VKIIYPILALLVLSACNELSKKDERQAQDEEPWQGWNKYQIKPEDSLTLYGHELISNTAYYLGPKGKVGVLTNGMNCQNCHLDAGTIPFANNYSAVVSTYPKHRDRSGALETIPKRVNDCMERSLNGKALDTSSREMMAILSYMHWLGDDIPKGKKPKGSGIMDIPLLDRPASPVRGLVVYVRTCARCHGAGGTGQPNPEGYGYTYPPLWGIHSYNTGAGLYRLSRFAGYVKNAMPFELANYRHPVLTNEEAWDVAAYVNSRPRPEGNISRDWPDISKKPFDHPFGPYVDGFSEQQHKFGPFKPIKVKASALAKK
jgi:thiosulfate dehydrogenase